MKEKLLFTGASGFLGRNTLPLLSEDYEVTTIGPTASDQIRVNFTEPFAGQLSQQYDVVLHAAGKAHVYPKNEQEEKEFFDVNYQGTVNLCKALEVAGLPKAFVFISTLDVYWSENYDNFKELPPPDCHPKTAYGKSKLMAEEFLTEWCKGHHVILGVLRPSLMVGPNPPGNLKDMINGIRRGYYFNIAGGKARKSLLMVSDIARLTPLVAQKGGTYNVCDSTHPSYGELSRLISQQLGKNKPLSIPMWMAKIAAVVGEIIPHFPFNRYRLKKLTTSATFSNEKARRELGWEPLEVLDNFKIR